MSVISYAQNGEDVLLLRVFDKRPGYYIDVGASHPIVDSVTKLLYENGWRGINVEPLPNMFELLRQDRPEDLNLNVGLSNEPGSLPFYVVPALDGLSTFSRTRAQELAGAHAVHERQLPVTTLADLCAEHVSGEIDVLKIDVEGHERSVILGADWRRWRPRVVVVEATEPNSPVPNHYSWDPLLLEAGYLFATFDGLNRYYVRQEDPDLIAKLQVPANLFDDYIAYRHAVRMWDVEDGLLQVGPYARRLALTVHRLVHRFPRVSSAVKRLLRAG